MPSVRVEMLEPALREIRDDYRAVGQHGHVSQYGQLAADLVVVERDATGAAWLATWHLAEPTRELRFERPAGGFRGRVFEVLVLIACVALFAVVQLSVAERIREIGIRIALGARPPQVSGSSPWSA